MTHWSEGGRNSPSGFCSLKKAVVARLQRVEPSRPYQHGVRRVPSHSLMACNVHRSRFTRRHGAGLHLVAACFVHAFFMLFVRLALCRQTHDEPTCTYFEKRSCNEGQIDVSPILSCIGSLNCCLVRLWASKALSIPNLASRSLHSKFHIAAGKDDHSAH